MLKLLRTTLLVSLLTFTGLAYGINLPYTYHSEAKMKHPSFGLVDKMYGYVDVNIGANKKGTIKVRFSNGRQLDGAIFNADVKFFSKSGKLIKTEHFQSAIGAAGFHGAVERDHSRATSVDNFHKIEVSYYLTEPYDYEFTIPIYQHPNAY